MEEMLRYMRAMVMLQLHTAQSAAADGERTPLRAEVLLADAGFGAREISSMLAKSPAAVAKAITRGRAARRGPTETSEGILLEGAEDHG